MNKVAIIKHGLYYKYTSTDYFIKNDTHLKKKKKKDYFIQVLVSKVTPILIGVGYGKGPNILLLCLFKPPEDVYFYMRGYVAIHITKKALSYFKLSNPIVVDSIVDFFKLSISNLFQSLRFSIQSVIHQRSITRQPLFNYGLKLNKPLNTCVARLQSVTTEYLHRYTFPPS